MHVSNFESKSDTTSRGFSLASDITIAMAFVIPSILTSNAETESFEIY